MPDEDQIQQRAARIRRRRNIGTFTPTNAEGIPRDIADEVVDEDTVAEAADSQNEPLSDAEELNAGSPKHDDDFNPRARLEMTKGTEVGVEYRLSLIHRMLMRGVPTDEIARELGVSISTVKRDKRELRKRLQNEAQDLDTDHMIGDTMAFFNEIAAMSLRVASNSRTPYAIRLAAMRTSLSSRNDMNKFLANAGVFDVLQYKRKKNSGQDDMERIVQMTEKLLGDELNVKGDFNPSDLLNLDEDELY